MVEEGGREGELEVKTTANTPKKYTDRMSSLTLAL